MVDGARDEVGSQGSGSGCPVDVFTSSGPRGEEVEEEEEVEVKREEEVEEEVGEEVKEVVGEGEVERR